MASLLVLALPLLSELVPVDPVLDDAALNDVAATPVTPVALVLLAVPDELVPDVAELDVTFSLASAAANSFSA